MTDNNKKVIEMQKMVETENDERKQTIGNFETNEAFQTIESQGSHFNLLEKVQWKSDEKAGSTIFRKKKSGKKEP